MLTYSQHKKNHFDVSFIMVDSKSLPTLGLAISESFNLTKRISSVNVSNKQFLSDFSDCFGEIGTHKNTHHIEIKDNVIQRLHFNNDTFSKKFSEVLGIS